MIASSASAESLTVSRYSRCCGVELRAAAQVGHADDRVHRRADLVAHVGEELALGSRGLLGADALRYPAP